MYPVWGFLIVVAVGTTAKPANHPSIIITASASFPNKIKKAFYETGDNGLIPVTSNRFEEEHPRPTLPTRHKREAEVDEVDGSGETGEVVSLPRGTTYYPELNKVTTTAIPHTSGIEISDKGKSISIKEATTKTSNGSISLDYDGYEIEETDVNYNGTISKKETFTKNSVRYAIILCCLIIFWILLAPVVCLFCRRRDIKREKDEKQRALADTALYPEMKALPLHLKRSNGHLPNNCNDESGPLVKDSMVGTDDSSTPSTPLLNGRPPMYRPPTPPSSRRTPPAAQRPPTPPSPITPEDLNAEDVGFIDDEKLWLSQEELAPPYDGEYSA